MHFGPAPRGFTECRGVVLRHDEDRLVRMMRPRKATSSPLRRARSRATCCCSPGVCTCMCSPNKSQGFVFNVYSSCPLASFHPVFVSRTGSTTSLAETGLVSSYAWSPSVLSVKRTTIRTRTSCVCPLCPYTPLPSVVGTHILLSSGSRTCSGRDYRDRRRAQLRVVPGQAGDDGGKQHETV